jgi:phosphate transport system substrate-binding protein
MINREEYCMKKGLRLVVSIALLLGTAGAALAGSLTYMGSVPIGENILPDAAALLQAKTGVAFSKIDVSGGSNIAVAAVMDGKCDIGGVARALNADEKKLKSYYQIVGYDALAVYTNKKNPVKNLTKEQLKGIFTGKITNWKEVGGKDGKIVLVTAKMSLKRATVEEFKKKILDGVDFCKTIEMDNPAEFVKYVSENENAITFDSFSYKTETAQVPMLNGVELNPANIRSGAYMLSKPLILVCKGLPKGDIKKVFDFVLSPEGQKIVSKNFIEVK